VSKIEDGGAAFPIDSYMLNPNATEKEIKEAQGMTLRDVFAKAALTGLVGDMMKSAADNRTTPHIAKKWLADGCYAIADAMIEARKGAQP
jgi:hypothetical protein